MVHDQFSDRSFRVLAGKLRAFGPEARELVKSAEINYDDQERLPESSWAWPEERRFPLHTKDQTALSMIYAAGETLPKHASERLEKAASLYGIALAPLEKTAQAAPELAPDYVLPERKFGILQTKEHVKEASQHFSNNYKKMDLETRAQAAASIVKKACELDCKIPPTLYKMAGMTQTSPVVLGEWLEVRANLSKDPVAKEGFQKLASYVQDKKAFARASRQDLVKIATTIALLDERAKLIPRYDVTLPDPLLTVFNTSKVASHSLMLAGKEIPVETLLKIDPATYGDVLGQDLVPEISENGQLKEAELLDVLKTLPADLQSLLVSSLGL